MMEATNISFDTKVSNALDALSVLYGSAELERTDKVLLMDGWNKILGWETLWKEAFWFRWRILVARKALLEQGEACPSKAHAAVEARYLVENNKDPLAKCFGSRRFDAKNLLLALVDSQVRSLCPHHQDVQREAYRPVVDDRGAAFGMTLECNTPGEIFRLFSTLGITPDQYLTLCEAFLWTMESHNPYMGDEDAEDLELSHKDSAYARFISAYVAHPGIQDGVAMREDFSKPLFTKYLPDFWQWVKHENDDFGEIFYSNLLTSYPELLDYFASADMDSLAHHILLALDLMSKYPSMAGEADSSFRSIVMHLGEMHRELGIPSDAYPQIGMNLISTLEPYAESYAELAEEQGETLTATEIFKAWLDVYGATMSFTFYPMLVEELKIRKATEFFEQVAEELDWSHGKLSKRLLEVKLEINATGSYQHTSEEIELGARLSWRNSVKCIGRISWNTLMVRDCRHVETPEGIIHEIEKHLELATAGTNLQSVMSVFRPKKPDEPWGIKFWSDQLVRYACYTNDDGTTMGDLANKHLTKYLIEKKLWTPPEPRTQHDVLPVVFRMPGRDEPIVHQFDSKYVDEAEILHPEFPEVAKLGHKWAAVPAINTFNMNLGGVEYGCMPFNGWFCSVEIVRDIMERYEGANEKWAAAIGIDPKTHRMWKARVAHEIDVAVLHSFDRAGYTIVDPDTVGEQFMTHCKRERESGRECPAQWSWIGGLTGPTNKTWHKEMRDFRVEPQYEYCAEQWSVTGYDESFPDEDEELFIKESASGKLLVEAENEEEFTIPRILIAYGSETGTAEAAAGRLGRALRMLKPIVVPLNNVSGLEIVKKQKISHILVLCSTFGKGKAPTSASKFVATEIPDGLLHETKVATLALGSSMYPDFCQAGKAVDKMLFKAGAEKLLPITLADEAVDSAGTVAQWINLVKNVVLPTSLKQAIEARSGAAMEPVQYQIKWQEGGVPSGQQSNDYHWPEEQSAQCVLNEELLVGGDIESRSTRRIGFKVPSGSSYVTGDHLCIHPLNRMEVVKRFAMCFLDEFISTNKKLNNGKHLLDADELVEWQIQQPFEVDCVDNGQVYPAQLCFSTPTTLAQALQAHVGLSLSEGTAADLIGVVTEYLKFEMDSPPVKQFKELAALIQEGGKGEEHQDAMNKFLSLYPTVVDLLEVIVPEIKCLKPESPISLAHLLSILPRLQPRLYSISSSSTTSPDVVEISVGVVHAVTDDRVKIAGVCSNYLARLLPGVDRANISVRTSSFRGPEDLINTPMIMVGAGTGLAVSTS